MSYGYGYNDGYGAYDQPQQGIDIGRLVRYGIGLLIALFGIATYLMQTQVNPVTGQRQHIALSVDDEKALGLEAAPKMAGEMGGDVPAGDPRAQAVLQVGRELVNRSDASRSPYADNFHFHLLNDPRTINAFALPGGQIFITKALYEKLSNEGELAGVLGHEIGHVVARHSAQQMAKGQLGQMLVGAVGVAASGDNRGRQATMAAMMAQQMLTLKYGRNDESEADRFGLKYMAESGYDPSCMLDVMRILKEAAGSGRQPEILSTHPLPETRIEAIRDTLSQEYPDGIPSNLSKGRSLPQARYTSLR
jgi:predicted Zn-dependent protease